jgi:hypothetical protein
VSTTTHHRPPLAAILLVPVVAAVVLTLFAWPSARLEPRDLPVGVAGEPAAATAIEQRLDARGGAFAVHRYADEAAARRAIEERDVYGAFVATPTGPKLLVASAASAAVSQALGHAAAGSPAAAAPVQDIVPATPATTALASLLLPLIIAGGLTGVAATRLAPGALRRTALIATGSVLVGLTATAIAQGWLGVVEGAWAANAGAMALTVAAMASLVAGLEALLGRTGAILGLLTLILVGNPFSGAASSPELLPQPTGAIGQLLPPGAGASLLRSSGFFEGAAAGGHVTVLAAWALAGVAGIFLAAARARHRVAAPAPLPV